MRKILVKVSLLSAAFLVLVSLSVDGFAQIRRNRTRTTSKTNTNVSNNEINDGLKAALFQGVENAVDILGRRNGFLDNVRVRIPLPNALQKTEKTLRFLGQGDKVDEFVESMNHAAEEAVPVATDIFLDSVKQMTFTDAKNILLSKQTDAATQFFRRTSENRLRDEFRPIVERFTESVGVTQNYKNMVGKYGFLGKALGQDASDIDGYVTEKALDGLFLLMADEEAKIRKDPIGRTTGILQKIFGILN